jgi:hypothetical protein
MSAVAGLLTSRFDAALAYAVEIHRTQVRKGAAIPYVGHLLGVAALVLEEGGPRTKPSTPFCTTPSRTKAARPDWPTSAPASATAWPPSSRAVPTPTPSRSPVPRPEDGISHASPRGARGGAARLRRRQALQRASHPGGLSRARRGALARFNQGRAEILWYYRGLVEAFRARRLAEELARTVGEREKLAG